MGLLGVDVRREILNSTYPALYVVMYSIMEGNTRENTWVDQQMKTLHVTKENHSCMLPLTKVSMYSYYDVDIDSFLSISLIKIFSLSNTDIAPDNTNNNDH